MSLNASDAFTLMEVNHALGNFQWKDAQKLEENAADDQKNSLIEMIINQALGCPDKPPTQAIDFYSYAGRITNAEVSKRLQERIINQWPQVACKVIGKEETIKRINALPEGKRPAKFQALEASDILTQNSLSLNPDHNCAQKSCRQISKDSNRKSGSKGLPPHLR